ncbi:uncharacterized protein [Anabrus simplex]|uniref:uncharacterized protein isoform X2 n=1 Tax=Anabrus simplex TaxID=316456 RepID=UPI0035A3C9B2
MDSGEQYCCCEGVVSEICKLSPLSQSSTEKVELCLHLMKRTSSYVLQLEIRHGLQLVETVMLALLVLLESKKIDSTLTDLCMLVMSNIHETWDIIEKKLKKYDWNETREENTNPQLFKFGFQQLNDFVQNSNPQLVYDNVCILGSLVFVHLGAMEKSLGFFHISTERHKDVQCQFLWHYMQAYASYSLKEWDMCMLHIKVLSSLPLTSESEAYYHLLSGQLQSSMKNYSRAHEEFGKAIESGHCLYSAVYHLLINMKNALLESTLGKIEGNSTTSLSYSKYRKALSSLYEFMELSKHNSSDYGEVSFGHKILTCLYQQEKVSPAQVFYMIAQEMFQMKTSSDEDDDDVAVCPSRVIAECLTSALELIKKSDGMDSFKPVRVLYHEAAVALLMDGQLAMAESACALPIEHPLSTDTPDTEEGILLSLHEDIVGLLLLAYIKRCTEQYDEEAELLNRCKKTVVNYFFNYSTKGAQLASTCKSHLMDALAARMYLMKGLMHLRNQNNVDAKENFERAFQHNPGDPLIQRHCTSACTANGKVSLATAPIAEQHSNIALQYLLSNDTSFK